MLSWLKSHPPTGQWGLGCGSGVVPRIVVLFLLDLTTQRPAGVTVCCAAATMLVVGAEPTTGGPLETAQQTSRLPYFFPPKIQTRNHCRWIPSLNFGVIDILTGGIGIALK